MKSLIGISRGVFTLTCALILTLGQIQPLHAQSEAAATLTGAVLDARGSAIPNAPVTIKSDVNNLTRKTTTGPDGRFTVSGLPQGSYTIEVTSPGFQLYSHKGVKVSVSGANELSVALAVAGINEEITVSADDSTSIASQLSPVKALLDEGSARSEISNTYIREFTSPMTDFTEVMQAAPGTFSVSPNGIGLGQSNTSFRGFIDGDYTIAYDGIPFEDTNSPTHHSWAFFPAPSIGGVDFDRSPGTASDIGPTNYGGSIHLLSPQLRSEQLLRISESYGSYNSKLIDGEYNSGLFGGKNPKANLWFDGHNMQSDGYETFNDQQRTAGALKFTYKFSDKTLLTIDANEVIMDANNSGNAPTREQLAEFGKNYYLDGTQFLSDGTTVDAQWYQFATYHVPTTFDYAGLNKDLGHGWKLEDKLYTYSYSNHEHYNNSTQNSKILDTFATAYFGTPTYYQTPKLSGGVPSKSGIDKMNQYIHDGDILTVSAASKYGVFRAGLWFEYASTNRYQIESNPLTWVDYVGPDGAIDGIKFHENFWTNSAQPFAEYQFVGIPKWTITLGVKDAYYNMSLKQFADNGHIVGNLGGAPYVNNDAGYNSWLPSFEANYRILPNWSAYVQYGMGSVIPPSSVFDVNETASTGATGVTVLPKPQVASTYQGGTVLKFNRVSVDADYYYIHFQNSYVATPVANSYTYNTTPPSNSQGIEAEGNIAITRKLSAFLNGTYASAKYVSTATTPELWVASAPKDTATEGITYQDKNWDLGFINKTVGQQWNDNTDASGNLLHQAIPISAFTVSNMFLNYTVRNGSRFDQSKIKLSLNNLFNDNNIVGVTAFSTGTAATPFVANGYDMLTTVPGRSVMVTFQLGFSPKER
jgi:iron complex outermembrane receptor protein